MLSIIFALVGLILLLFSFTAWQRPSTFGFKETPDSSKWARGVALGLWTLALPAYWLWEWYFSLKEQVPKELPELQNFQYGHQLWNSIWIAVAALLGALFGVKSASR